MKKNLTKQKDFKVRLLVQELKFKCNFCICFRAILLTNPFFAMVLPEPLLSIL